MILSPKYNFLLIKNHKVGGTSLEIELSQKINDEHAIFTKIHPKHELHKEQNHLGFYNHISYLEVCQKLGSDYVNSLESVVFIRNPFDTVLSHLFMSMKWSGIEEINADVINKYFNNDLALDKLVGSRTRRLYTIDNKIAVKNILRYEDGLQSINKILNHLEIPEVENLYREKAYKPQSIQAADIFTEKHIDIIRNDWAWEFATFDYSLSPVYNG